MTAIVRDDYGSPGMKHQRVVVTRHGRPEVLQTMEEDLPEPRAGEARVKVLAAGVSGCQFSPAILFKLVIEND